jgi:V/A-type H+-transporting ATPase subunit E
MSSSEKTLSKVSEEFLSEVYSDIKNASQELLEITEKEMRDVKESFTKIIESAQKQAESLKRQIIGSAEIEARNYQLRVLEDAVVAVINSALERLQKIEQERYEEALSKMLHEAYETIGKECIVYCNKKDRSLVSSLVKKLKLGKISVSPEHIDTAGGIVVESKDRTIRFDNTVEARIERMKQELRKEISSILSSK